MSNVGEVAARPARGVVLTHGGMAEGLVDAVRQIAGATPDALLAVPNPGMSHDELYGRTREALARCRNVVFTDLASGSCYLAAMAVARERPDSTVVTGVNLPMLLDFVFHRRMDFDALVPRLIERGRCAIGPEPNAKTGHEFPNR